LVVSSLLGVSDCHPLVLPQCSHLCTRRRTPPTPQQHAASLPRRRALVGVARFWRGTTQYAWHPGALFIRGRVHPPSGKLGMLHRRHGIQFKSSRDVNRRPAPRDVVHTDEDKRAVSIRRDARRLETPGWQLSPNTFSGTAILQAKRNGQRQSSQFTPESVEPSWTS